MSVYVKDVILYEGKCGCRSRKRCRIRRWMSMAEVGVELRVGADFGSGKYVGIS